MNTLDVARASAGADVKSAHDLMKAATGLVRAVYVIVFSLMVIVFALLMKMPWYMQVPGYVMLTLMLLAMYGECWTLKYMIKGNLLRAQQHQHEVNNAP